MRIIPRLEISFAEADVSEAFSIGFHFSFVDQGFGQAFAI